MNDDTGREIAIFTEAVKVRLRNGGRFSTMRVAAMKIYGARWKHY